MQVLGAYGPAIAAVIVTLIMSGLNGLQDLLNRLLAWRVGIVWYLVALFLPAIISLLNTALHTMFGGDAPNFAEPPISRIVVPSPLAGLSPAGLVVPLFIYHLIFGPAIGEELGWRGFVLEKFQQRQSPLRASVWVGFCWTIWALPFSWSPSTPGIMTLRVILLLLGAIPASILSTWIYNSTQGSLLLVVLFNNAVKLTDLFVTPAASNPVFTIASFWIVALLVLRRAGSALGSRSVPPGPEQSQGRATENSKWSMSAPS
jgi:membrane protease YdiL (CAAX protease family)